MIESSNIPDQQFDIFQWPWLQFERPEFEQDFAFSGLKVLNELDLSAAIEISMKPHLEPKMIRYDI